MTAVSGMAGGTGDGTAATNKAKYPTNAPKWTTLMEMEQLLMDAIERKRNADKLGRPA